MEIRPPDTPVDDPFWAAVRRRHPDVDLVLLPPDPDPEPEPDRVAVLDEDAARRARSEIAEEAAAIWAAAAPLTQVAPETRLRPGGAAGTVRAVARVVDHRNDGYGVLVSLRHELEQRGWHVDRPEAGLERLVGMRDGASMKASYAEAAGVVVLELVSAPMRGAA